VRTLAAVVKAIWIGIHQEVHRCKREALERTKGLCKAVIAFYINFLRPT
jgi:hypothetical protein